jgi:SulP family sulfate permease
MPNVPRFRPKLIEILSQYTPARLRNDILAGITVGILALPLAIAFAIASGMTPESGIYTAIIAGFIISTLGGSRVQIGGPTGAFIVIVYGIVINYGVPNLIICTMMAGLMLLAMGLLGLGSWIRFIPVSVVSGFTKGIALLILLSQVRDFLGLKIERLPAEFFSQITTLWVGLPSANTPTIILGLACIGTLLAWPQRWRSLPSPIAVLILATAGVALLNIPVETIGSRYGGIPQSLPSFSSPLITIETLRHLISPAIAIALLGAIESLLSATVADHQIDDRHDPNQELMAQGIANIVAPLFGGFCATGAIARTNTNVRMGAFGPISGIVHALTLLLIILVAAPLAKFIPLVALSAILIMVAWHMGEWRQLKEMKRYSLNYRAILMASFLLTVIFDLTVAVEIGMVMAAIFFITRITSLTTIQDCTTDEADSAHIKHYQFYGSLFFGSAQKLEPLLDHGEPIDTTQIIILDLEHTLNIDTTGLDLLEAIQRKLLKHNKTLILCNANTQALSLIQRSGFANALGANLYTTTQSAMDAALIINQKKPRVTV